MPSGEVLGALGGSLLGPLFTAIMHRFGRYLDINSGKESRKHRDYREKQLLLLIALGNSLLVAGAVVMAGACMRDIRPYEVLVAVLIPVPYAVYRALHPCIEEYPRF